MPLPISVFIITHNEADRIGRAVESVREWTDEIIVIDSGSSDDTLKVAYGLGVKALYHAWPGYGLQKRFGEEQCKNRWLLNIDADEEITPELAQEIHTLFANGEPALAGYVLRIRDLLPGETKLAPLAHTNYALRLYNREKARFSDSAVHDTVQLLVPPPLGRRLGGGRNELQPEQASPPPNLLPNGGGIKTLKHPVLHRSFRSLSHAIAKMNSYSDVQAQNLRKKGLKLPMLRLITEFPVAFFKDYILRGYILRGRRGFVNSVLYGFTRFVRIAKCLEKSPLPPGEG